MNQIDVIIADDHEIIRYGISSFLSDSKDINIVGEASSGKECIELYRQHLPDLCMLDISMPGIDGLEAARVIRGLSEEVKILILSMHTNKKLIAEALDAGINGYLLKDTGNDVIRRSIRLITGGQDIFSDPIIQIIRKDLLSYYPSADETRCERLTEREQEILQLIVDGYTSRDIGDELFISPRTVDTHRSNILRKLETNNIAELVRYAISHRLVSIEPQGST